MNRSFILIAITTLFFSFVACKKSEDVTVSGKGGNAVFHIYPKHGVNEQLDYCWLYVEYNTLNPPTDGVYDDSIKCNLVDSALLGVFTGLHRGDYYIYGKGYSPSHGGGMVTGSYPIFIDNENKIYDIELTLNH